MINIVLLAIHYPFAIASYYVKALQNRADVNLQVVGPDHGNWIPWMGGMYLDQKYAPHVDIPMQKFTASVLPSAFWNALPWQPDLIINIDAGYHMATKPQCDYAVVGTDAHCLDYDVQRGMADKFFNMHERYSKPGDIHLPYAYSPDYHYPEAVPMQYDACLIGMPYPQRNQLAAQLRGAGVNLYFNNGEVFDEYRRVYRSSAVGLNWASMDDLNARHFELLAMKVPSVQFHTTDADLYFENGKDYLSFKTASEAKEKVLYLLQHKDEAMQMAESGYEKVKEHTYDARISQILKEFGYQ